MSKLDLGVSFSFQELMQDDESHCTHSLAPSCLYIGSIVSPVHGFVLSVGGIHQFNQQTASRNLQDSTVLISVSG